MDGGGARSDRCDRVGSTIAGVEHCAAWVDWRAVGYDPICFDHSSLFFPSLQHIPFSGS
ncbi:putative amino acid permease 7 [Senna tora]|uniref:Putative amino acid permease 7 n=1 Tax=Senna tora TaxID=362788 RepID=A0A834WPI9_9FABA|nr:putative amino acid permease 7 [Senna tora]